MFSIERTRVFDRRMTWSRNSAKPRHPVLPASTTVVTPLRNVKLSGRTLNSPVYSVQSTA